MKAEFKGNQTILRGVSNFDLEHIFDCGQCFRFNRIEKGIEGVALGGYLSARQEGDTATLFPCSEAEYRDKWENFFDLGRDYSCLFGSADNVLKESLQYASGLRILNQQPFETLVSFIISANNNVKRIRGIVQRLCESFGEPFAFEGRGFFDFPTSKALANADSTRLAGIGAGYRAPFIRDAARMIADGFSLEALRGMEYQEAKRELVRLPGVGPKVADCVLLFSLGFACAFPADVWIKRVLLEHYNFKGNDKQTVAFALQTFGANAGIAQQYLFFWMREKGKA
jgi:N-glycosylase/DNA lyase